MCISHINISSSTHPVDSVVYVFQYQTVGEGNQHGSHMYNVLQNWLEVVSHENLLFLHLLDSDCVYIPYWYVTLHIQWLVQMCFLIPDIGKRKPTWRLFIWWLAILAWYDVTWKPSILTLVWFWLCVYPILVCLHLHTRWLVWFDEVMLSMSFRGTIEHFPEA